MDVIYERPLFIPIPIVSAKLFDETGKKWSIDDDNFI
jgi:hypothetical protein